MSSKFRADRFEKSSKILGDTIPYHPHGLDSLYGVLVNLTTDMNGYRLFRGKGNWGGVGFSAAAYRYTEAYLNGFARYMFTDLAEHSEFMEGESGLDEPRYLPALIPYSLLVGSTGIGVGLSTNIMPLDAMDLIDYYVAVIRGEEPKTPTPDLGNYILDMSDGEIDASVEGSEGQLRVRSIVTVESDSVVVIDDLYNRDIHTLVRKLGDWIDPGYVDFRDETTTRPRYVFEIADPKKVSMEELKGRISNLTKARKTYTRLVVDGEVAVYSTLRHQVEKSLEYLNRCLDRKFESELESLRFTESVLSAIEFMKGAGVIERLPKLTRRGLGRELSDHGFPDDVVSAAMSKSISYLTRDHAGELRDVRAEIRRLRDVDRTDYLVSLYEGLREVVRPLYEAAKHTVRRSKLLKSPKFSLVDGSVIRISDRGRLFDSTVYAVHSDGTMAPYAIGAMVRRDIPMEPSDAIDLVGLVSDRGEYVVFVTNRGRALTTDLGRASQRAMLRLDDGEMVVFSATASKDESGAIPFKYKRKAYDGSKYLRRRLSSPQPLGRPVPTPSGK